MEIHDSSIVSILLSYDDQSHSIRKNVFWLWGKRINTFWCPRMLAFFLFYFLVLRTGLIPNTVQYIQALIADIERYTNKILNDANHA